MRYRRLLAVLVIVFSTSGATAMPLDLQGFADDTGAISIQHNGETLDPYFTLQALLLAQENGLDTSAYRTRWANWLVARQKPDGTFDRFCRKNSAWTACKTADADDAMLAKWLKFLESMPSELSQNGSWQKSHRTATETLSRLVDPRWHIFLVSPVYLHGLFMDNLEVWSYKPAHALAQVPLAPSFTESIRKQFWDEAQQRFLVSTQPEQKNAEYGFYPDAVAQIYPLVVNYPHVRGGAALWYRDWITRHRAEWLSQVHHDFAWGLIALVAFKQGDVASARCWLATTQPYRRSVHWTVTDEVVAQVLLKNGVAPADLKMGGSC